jgi:membrane protein implicated in regulation of membrane protease activity
MANDVESAAGGRENFDQILRQLGRIRRRINSLAAQQLIFSSLAVLIGAAGLVVLAALLLRPQWFLIVGLVVAATALASLPVLIWRPARRFSGLRRTAEIADRQAELRGRLTTLVVTRNGEQHRLWPYLVEDTLSRSADFHPGRIVQRRVSRALYGLLGACLIGVLAAMLTFFAREQRQEMQIAMTGPGLEISPSQVRPGEGSSGAEADIQGDPAQLRNLAQRLQRQESNLARRSNPLDRLANRAKDLASSLQDKLTGNARGNEIKIKMRLAKALGDDQSPSLAPPPPDGPHGDHGSQLADNGPETEGPGAGNMIPGSQPDQGTTPGAPAGAPRPGAQSRPSQGGGAEQEGGNSSNANGMQARSGDTDSGGVSAGSGSDASGLMGPPEALVRHRQENFELPVDAQAQPGSQIRDGEPYNPPRVKVELNSQQAPDEPVVRADVPPGDRETIRRVFER